MRGESVIARPIQVKFDPKPDITAYELAKLCLMPERVKFMPANWEALDPKLKRHFQQD